MKAKIHAVKIAGHVLLVWAQTKNGAVRDALEVIAKDAEVEVATGEMLYAAGQQGATLYGEDKYRRMVGPNQQELPGGTVEGDAT
jgi:hypothetical protein